MKNATNLTKKYYECTLSDFGGPSRPYRFCLIAPNEIFAGKDNNLLLPEPGVFPYGEEFTRRIAGHIFRKHVTHRRYGVLPGRFYHDEGCLHFEVLGDIKDAISLLVYADASMTGFAGPAGFASFNIGKTGLYGMITSVNYVVEEVFHTFGTMEKLLPQVNNQ